MSIMRLLRRTNQSILAATLLLIMGTGPGIASAALSSTVHFNIAAQPLNSAIIQYTEQSGVQITSAAELLKGRHSGGVTGTFPASAALTKLLADTDLVYDIVDDNTVVITAAGSAAARDPRATQSFPARASGKSEDRDSRDRLRLAQTNQGKDQSTSSVDQSPDDAPENTENKRAKQPEEVVVTGTNIRGVADQFSPVISLSQGDIDRAGFGGLPDVIASLPQNFGGGAGGNLARTTQTFAGIGAITPNLRGLGNEATLTLINGRRIAPSGLNGNISDISGIPVSAIERVDVLTDGASAIYGSDAVAGVVNIITNKSYDGAETRLRYGGATDGGADGVMVGQVLGRTWEQGRTLLTYEYGSTSALDTRDKSFTSQQPAPSDLLPAERHSSFFTSSQLDIGSNADMFLDGYYTSRRSTANTTLVGDTSYDHETSRAAKYSLTTGTDIKFRGDWHGDASLSWARSSAPDLSDGINPSTGQLLSFSNQTSNSRVLSGEAKVSGPILKLGGGDADVLVGTEARRESFDGYQNNSGQVAQVTVSNRDVIAGFAESYLPFVTDRNSVSGIQRLAVTLAGRYEKYSLVGSSLDPKVGVIYEPLAGLTLRSTFGTSFRAPGLYQLNDNITGALLVPYLDPAVPGGKSLAITIFGGTTALKPERSRNITVGFDLAPPSVPGFRASATLFSINFHDQIVTPFPMVTFDPGFTYFNFPIPVTRNITQAQIASILARAGFFINVAGKPPSAATIFIDTRPINAAATVVNGIDYNLTYNRATDVGSFHPFLGGTYLLKNTRQFTGSSPVLSELNLVGQPLRFRLRGGITYSAGAFDVTPFLNYVGGYHETLAVGGPAPVDAWTTLDLSVRCDFGKYANASFWKGFAVTLVVQNAFNRNPPVLAVPNSGVGYVENFDPANADPRGRYASLQFVKQWMH